MDALPKSSLLQIIYIVDQFPSSSEYFILNEMKEVIKKGHRIKVLAFRNMQEHHIAPGDEGWLQHVSYAVAIGSLAMVRAHINTLLRFPKRYVQIFLRTLFTGKEPWARRMKAFALAGHFLYVTADEKPDLIHAHFLTLPATAAMLMSGICGVPFSCSAHAADIYVSRPAAVVEKINAAAFVVTCTTSNQQFLQALEGVRHRIYHNYHGIDLGQWPRVKQAAGIPAGRPPQLITVCRLVEKKGLQYLLEAVRQLHQNGQDIKLSIIGDGPLRTSLETFAAAHLPADCVRFYGQLPQQDIRTLYAAADIFVLPCVVAGNGDRDGLPNVLVEALATGLPAIATAVSAIPELLVDGETGLLVKEKDVESLKAAILQLTADPALCRQIADNGRKKLETGFSIDNSTARLCELFNKTMDAQGA